MDLCAFFDGHKLAQSPVQCNQRDDVALRLCQFVSNASDHAAHQKLILEVPSLRSTSRRNCAFHLDPNHMLPRESNEVDAMYTSVDHLPLLCLLGLDN